MEGERQTDRLTERYILPTYPTYPTYPTLLLYGWMGSELGSGNCDGGWIQHWMKGVMHDILPIECHLLSGKGEGNGMERKGMGMGMGREREREMLAIGWLVWLVGYKDGERERERERDMILTD